jgi:hypothetical protein
MRRIRRKKLLVYVVMSSLLLIILYGLILIKNYFRMNQVWLAQTEINCNYQIDESTAKKVYL